MLIGCGLVGATVGRLLRLPAAFMMGPMIDERHRSLAGLTNSKPPGELVAAAQVVVGAGIGCRFVGAAIDKLHKEMRLDRRGVDHDRLAVLFAKVAVALTGLNLDATVLSYAPGGFAEMSLIGWRSASRSRWWRPTSVPPVPDRAHEPVHLPLVAATRADKPSSCPASSLGPRHSVALIS